MASRSAGLRCIPDGDELRGQPEDPAHRRSCGVVAVVCAGASRPPEAGHHRKPINGAVEHALANGTPAVEAYPVDNGGERVDMTMACVGTRHMFEKAGFTVVAETDSVLDGFPRVLMRRKLRRH